VSARRGDLHRAVAGHDLVAAGKRLQELGEMQRPVRHQADLLHRMGRVLVVLVLRPPEVLRRMLLAGEEAGAFDIGMAGEGEREPHQRRRAASRSAASTR
jgi:hypothetical protein